MYQIILASVRILILTKTELRKVVFPKCIRNIVMEIKMQLIVKKRIIKIYFES